MGVQPRKDSAFHSGRVQVLPWCRLCQTATIITWPLGKRRKRPKPKPTAAAATPNEPKGAKRTRRRHSVQHHHTHTQALGAMPPHTQRSHSVHVNSLSFRSGRLRTSSFPRVATTKPTKPAISTNFKISKQFLQIPRISEVSRFRCGGARERGRPERKDSDFRGVALPSIGLRVS